MKRDFALFIVSSTFALAGIACGASTPSAEAPTPSSTTSTPSAPTTAAKSDGKGRPSVSQELGEIDKAAVDAAFAKLGGAFKQCQKQGLSRVDYLAGDYEMFLRIGEDGRVKYGYLESSTLGDRATEKCLLDAATGSAWPKPKGGEAEVRRKSGFTPGDAREPTEWGADKMTGAGDAIKKCTSGVSGSFQVTAYVEPDGKQGKVVAAGAAASTKEGAEKIDCIVDAVKSFKAPSPGSYAAKVTFKP